MFVVQYFRAGSCVHEQSVLGEDLDSVLSMIPEEAAKVERERGIAPDSVSIYDALRNRTTLCESREDDAPRPSRREAPCRRDRSRRDGGEDRDGRGWETPPDCGKKNRGREAIAKSRFKGRNPGAPKKASESAKPKTNAAKMATTPVPSVLYSRRNCSRVGDQNAAAVIAPRTAPMAIPRQSSIVPTLKAMDLFTSKRPDLFVG
jgi:hypothetical protein